MRTILAALASLIAGCGSQLPVVRHPPPPCVPAVEAGLVALEDALSTAFSTPTGSELVLCVPNTINYVKYPVYAVSLSGLKTGMVVMVDAEVEVTNDTIYTYMFGDQLVLSPSLSCDDGTPLDQANTTNLMPIVHHLTSFKGAVYAVTKADEGTRYLLLCAWVSTDATMEGGLKVERGYGGLEGTVVKGGSDR
jgi:hypothetical protein